MPETIQPDPTPTPEPLRLNDNDSFWRFARRVTGAQETEVRDGGGEHQRALQLQGGGILRALSDDEMSSRAGIPESGQFNPTAPGSPIPALLIQPLIAREASDEMFLDRIFVPTGANDENGMPVYPGRPFYFGRMDNSHLMVPNPSGTRTERSNWPRYAGGVTWEFDVLEEYMLGTEVTVEEMQRAFGMRIGIVEQRTFLAQKLLSNWFQMKAINILNDVTPGNTYLAANIDTNGAGAEWDNGGDPLADLEAGIDALVASGVRKLNIEAFLDDNSITALRGNTTTMNELLPEKSGYTMAAVQTDDLLLDVLRQRLGIRRVNRVSGPFLQAEGDTVPKIQANDNAILLEVPAAERIQEGFRMEVPGTVPERFGSHYAVDRGIPLDPFLDRNKGEGVWVYPYKRHFKLRITDQRLAYIVVNTSAAV